jgi:hypothetical protein
MEEKKKAHVKDHDINNLRKQADLIKHKGLLLLFEEE